MNLARRFLSFASLNALFFFLIPVQAQNLQVTRYPDKVIKLIVAKPPGGLDDNIARILQPSLQKLLGTTVIVENIGGAQGIIGTQALIRAEPDGYRLMVMNIRQQFQAGAVMDKAPYDLGKDITPIIVFASTRGAVIVHPSIPGNDLVDVLEFAKANPNKVHYGTTGVGSSSHLYMHLAAQQIGAQMLAVPYKGGGPGSLALASGDIQVFYTDWGTALSTARMGRGVRIVAQTGPGRAKEAPDIPLFPEPIRKLFSPSSIALIGPRGIDSGIVEKIANAIKQVVAQSDVAEQLRKVGAEPHINDATWFRSEIDELTTNWGPTARAIQAQIDGKTTGVQAK